MTIDTYSSHRVLAERRPVKGRRYVRSVKDTLARDGIAAGERARLEDALRGLLDGLRTHGPVCEDCGRSLTRLESIAQGRGDTCAHKLEARAS